MAIRRNTFFLLLALIIIAVAGLPKLIWVLGSEKTTAVFAFQGRGNALEQLPDRSAILYFALTTDTVWFKAPGRIDLPENSQVPIRYNKSKPEDAKIDNFRGIWLPTIVYGSLPLLVVLVAFLHPHIIPWRSRIVLIPRKPFIKVIT